MTGFRRSSVSRRIALGALAAAFGAGLVAAPQAQRRRWRRSPICFRRRRSCRPSRRSQLAKGKGYFKEAGLDVDFRSARGGVEVAKQVGAGNAPIGGIVGDGPIMVRGNGVPVKIVAVFGGKGFMQTRGARGFRHREAGRPEGQDHHRDVVSGHHLSTR